METSQSVPELVAAARANVKASEDRVAEILIQMDRQNGSKAQVEDLRAATVALELAAVDIFTLFEARMQHHFKRGPFSRKLKTLLTDSKKADLADKIHEYYLVINVLKHGKGESYRELLNSPKSRFVVKSTDKIIAEDAPVSNGLIDVSMPGFFEGLTSAILEAHQFLENRQVT